MKIDRNARPGISDAQIVRHRRRCATCRETEPPGWRVLDGVIEQIEQHAPHKRFIGANQRFSTWFARQRDLLCRGQRPDILRTFGREFVEIEIRVGKRVLAGVGSRKREEIFDDAFQSFRFIRQNSQSFAIFLLGAIFFRERDFRFAAQNCDRRAKFVRRVSDETLLAIERMR